MKNINKTDFYLLILAVVIGVILYIVPASPNAITKQEYTSEFTTVQNATVVNIQWVTQEEVNKVWQEKYNGNVIGFAQYDIPGVLCTINSIKPTDWNDKFAMEVIGHELMHCLGAKHNADNDGLRIKDVPEDELHNALDNPKK